MLVFGHIGITLGVGLAGIQIYGLIKKKRATPKFYETLIKNPENEKRNIPVSKPAIDLFAITFCILGSLLPDMIDKPIGHFLFKGVFHNNGRVFSHTLLFAFLTLCAGSYFYVSKKKLWLLALSYGVFMHLILDFMWQTPQILFWPLFGLNFPWSNEYNWSGIMIYKLLHNPQEYIIEFIGLFITGMSIWILIREKYVVLSFPNRRRQINPSDSGR